MSLATFWRLSLAAACLCTGSMARADAFPFGVASAYNVVALGVAGSSSLTGTIGSSADIGGRIAAADKVTVGTTIGSTLNADPFGSAASFGVVSTNGLNAGEQFNINGGGNVYAPGSNGNFNFNDGGHRVTSGSSGVDFASLRNSLDQQSLSLAGLTANGQSLGTNQSGYGNPSFYVLKGTDPSLNIFSLSAAVFGDANHPLNIVVPTGSTVVINVTGNAPQLNTGIYFNGTQYAGDSAVTSNLLFNFATATSVTIDGQFSASLLAPFALLTGNAQMDGNFIAASVGQTGEIHNVEFTGTLPTLDPSTAVTPEPGSILLVGTGLFAAAGSLRRRRSSVQV